MNQDCVTKYVVTCPKCPAQIAVDAATGEILFMSASEEVIEQSVVKTAGPCIHLACMWTSIRVLRQMPDGSLSRDPEHSRGWVWEYGKGLCPAHPDIHSERPALANYMTGYFNGWLPPDFRPTSDHSFVGRSANFCDRNIDGGVEFLLDQTLNGYAVFASNPEAVMQEIAARSKEYGERALASDKGTIALLSSNTIGNEGAKALASSPCLANLTGLFLGRKQSGEEGAKG
jgi:hypothetical protein